MTNLSLPLQAMLAGHGLAEFAPAGAKRRCIPAQREARRSGFALNHFFPASRSTAPPRMVPRIPSAPVFSPFSTFTAAALASLSAARYSSTSFFSAAVSFSSSSFFAAGFLAAGFFAAGFLAAGLLPSFA